MAAPLEEIAPRTAVTRAHAPKHRLSLQSKRASDLPTQTERALSALRTVPPLGGVPAQARTLSFMTPIRNRRLGVYDFLPSDFVPQGAAQQSDLDDRRELLGYYNVRTNEAGDPETALTDQQARNLLLRYMRTPAPRSENLSSSIG